MRKCLNKDLKGELKEELGRGCSRNLRITGKRANINCWLVMSKGCGRRNGLEKENGVAVGGAEGSYWQRRQHRVLKTTVKIWALALGHHQENPSWYCAFLVNCYWDFHMSIYERYLCGFLMHHLKKGFWSHDSMKRLSLTWDIGFTFPWIITRLCWYNLTSSLVSLISCAV